MRTLFATAAEPRERAPYRMRRVGMSIGVAMLVAACGSGTATVSSSGPSASATPASSGPTASATPTSSASATDQRTSEPYWAAVATLRGGGSSTTDAFTIAADALQWRATYQCQGSQLTAVAVHSSGQALPTPVVAQGNCPAGTPGYATQAGTFRLRVSATGPWTVVVEQQLDVPLLQPPPATLASATLVAQSSVYPVDAAGEGAAKLYRLPGGGYLIRLEKFYTTANSDLLVRLSPLVSPKSTAEFAASSFVQVAPLAATVGSMNYPVPSGINVLAYHSLFIWCEATTNVYAAAAL